jgi:hypothetical protein
MIRNAAAILFLDPSQQVLINEGFLISRTNFSAPSGFSKNPDATARKAS